MGRRKSVLETVGKINKDFGGIYRNKKVFITGNTGFKGSWLALWLSKLGANIVGYSLDIPTNPSHYSLLNLGYKSLIGDILYKELLSRSIEENRPDIIFHLAAQPLVRKAYLSPSNTLETNIMGTVNILESSRLFEKIKAIVLITSDKCYENTESLWGYREKDPMGGDDPYSASKGCAELVVNAYVKSFFHPEMYKKNHKTLVATARAGNVIGGGDWAIDRLIPDAVKAASLKKIFPIRRPNATRPWQHVLEPLHGYLKLGQKLLEEKKEYSGNWNFGPEIDSNLSVSQIILEAQKHWPEIRFKISEEKNTIQESNFLMIDSTKAKRKLGWWPIWDKNKTIQRTIDWYKKYYETDKISSVDDLENYIKDANSLIL